MKQKKKFIEKIVTKITRWLETRSIIENTHAPHTLTHTRTRRFSRNSFWISFFLFFSILFCDRNEAREKTKTEEEYELNMCVCFKVYWLSISHDRGDDTPLATTGWLLYAKNVVCCALLHLEEKQWQHDRIAYGICIMGPHWMPLDAKLTWLNVV